MRKILCLMVLLQGCSQHGFLQKASINSFVAQHDYKSALEILDNTDPENNSARNALLREANAYEAELIRNIKAEMNNQYWGKALYLCEQNKTLLPEPGRLLQLESSVQQKISTLSRQNQIRLTLAKAELELAKEADLAFEKQTTYPSNAFYFDSWVRSREQDNLAETLLDLALQSKSENDYESLEACYQTALALNPQIRFTPGAISLAGDISAHNNSVRSQRYFGLLAELGDAMENQQFERVRELQNKIRNAGFSTPAGENKLREADNLIAASCLQYDKQAEIFYRMGDMPKAVSLWQQALVLLPDNPEYQDKLRKARKIMQKMDLLRHNQGGAAH